MTSAMIIVRGIFRARLVVIILLNMLAVSTGRTQTNYDPAVCGPLTNAFGPFDFRTVSEHNRTIVERFHFGPEVERLQGHRGDLGRDLDYVLRAMPNHPRALMAISRYSVLEGQPKPTGARQTVDCYFARAIAFAPSDAVPHVIYGIHLLKVNQHEGAIASLLKAREMGSEDPNIDYNLGLAYFDLKQFDKAREHARRAYELGYPLPGLRDKLRKAGHWE